MKQETSQLSNATGENRISPDSPVIDPGKDLLGHAPFAKALATGISKMSPAEGLVIALHGPWGSGKTTILNFIEHYLQQESEATRPIIIKFAPWWFSGQHDLTQRFFDQLAGHLKEDDRVSRETLDRLSEFMEAISDLPIDIPILSELLRSGGKILRALTEARQKDLTKLKERLEDGLKKLGRKIIVVIDDIDRLTTDEIRQMFGVVKAVANFPNTIYLLAFDRDVAVKALEPLQDVRKGIPGKNHPSQLGNSSPRRLHVARDSLTAHQPSFRGNPRRPAWSARFPEYVRASAQSPANTARL